ncbi:MAG: hypothetical protein PWQ84_1446 [Thermotogaceae bacterium]|nr:hypothetical protein [Thermotogaceae bacterium]
MPSWLYLLPFLWFFVSGIVKFVKSGGQKIVMLGDFVIGIGFLYQLIFPNGTAGFYIAGVGVIVDLILYIVALKNTKRIQAEKKREESQQ